MTRWSPEGAVPLLSFEGSAFECGQQLGMAWQQTLRLNAERARGRWEPWWWKGRGGVTAEQVEQRAPFLVELFRGMAAGAGIDEALCGCSPIASPLSGCTSFGIHQEQTLDGRALAGQTKDTGRDRTFLYQVLRLRMTDAPGYLTLTYPGELLGHGFAETGMCVFRNSLFVTPSERGGELPFDAFGLLTLFSPGIDAAAEMTQRLGVRSVGHVSVTEASGRTVGFELCRGQVQFIPGRDGLFAHANHPVSAEFQALVSDRDRESREVSASEHRERRLYGLMEQDRGRLTPQIMLGNLADHANFPCSICHHRDCDNHTTAAVVAEPARGLLHVTRGAPCQNWPVTYRL
jgi:isopenicillin-N N-acyltransferase-like protein